jgi:hypothetical protein
MSQLCSASPGGKLHLQLKNNGFCDISNLKLIRYLGGGFFGDVHEVEVELNKDAKKALGKKDTELKLGRFHDQAENVQN